MSFPILYDKMETEFGHLGLGVLRDAVSCIVTEERNGIFELEMEYPISGALFDLLENDRIIKVDAGHELKEQRFRIKRITKKMNGLIEVYAEHVSYLTQDLTLTPEVELRGNAQQALNQWKNNIIDENPFEVFSDVALNSETKLKIQDFETARRVLGGVQGSILDVWGGEYKFDNYRISLLENRGGNSNTLISYGRNLTDLDQEENIANTFTSVYPFAMYRDHSEDGLSSNEQLITIDGYIVDSEHVNKYPNRRILPIDFSSEFDSDKIPTQARLRALAEQYIQNNNIGVPSVSLNVSFVDLTKSLEFDGLHYEQVNLCDVVPIYFEKLGIRARAKINRIRWDALLDQYESLEIGDARTTLSDKIRDIENDINNIGNRPPVIGSENITNIRPQPITNLEAVGAYGAIHLFWGNQGLTVSHFELHRSMVSGFTPDEYTRIYRGRANGFSDVVGANRQYFYRSRAVNFHGVAGDWSNEVMAQTAQIPFEDLEQEVKDGIEGAINDANNAMQEAEDAKNVAQGAFDNAQNALDTSQSAQEIATSAFDTAQGAFDSAQNALEGSKGAQEMADNALVRIDSVEGEVTQITADVKGVGIAVGNIEGDITNLQVTASGLQTSISNVDGRVASLSATVDGIETTVTDLSGNVSNLVQASDRLTIRISDTEDNISTLQQTSNSLVTRITNAEDDISTVTQLATGLQARVEDAEGNITTVTQLATGLQARVEDAEGNITTVTQLATGLQSKVEDAEGNITQLQTTADGLGIRISDTEENISNLNATAEYLHGRIENAEGDIGQIRLTADSLATRITNAEDDISTVTQLATGLQTAVSGPNGLQSQVTQLNNQFSITVRRIDVLETDVQSQFSVLENAINMRVQSGDVINQINISDESVLIQGNKIRITGQTLIDDAIITDANIANATITSAKIKDLDADKITTGTLKAINIQGVEILGSTIQTDSLESRITMSQGFIDIGVNHQVTSRLSGSGWTWTAPPYTATELNNPYVKLQWTPFTFPDHASGWDGITFNVGTFGDFAIASGGDNARGLLWATQNRINLDSAHIWNASFQTNVLNGNSSWQRGSGTGNAGIGTHETGVFEIYSGWVPRILADASGALVNGRLDVSGNVTAGHVSTHDNGWINVWLNTNNFWHFNVANSPTRVRRNNGVVEFELDVTPRATAFNSIWGSGALVATLPPGWRPATESHVVHSAGAGATYRVTVNSSGNIYVAEFAGGLTQGNANSTGTRFRIAATFLAY